MIERLDYRGTINKLTEQGTSRRVSLLAIRCFSRSEAEDFDEFAEKVARGTIDIAHIYGVGPKLGPLIADALRLYCETKGDLAGMLNERKRAAASLAVVAKPETATCVYPARQFELVVNGHKVDSIPSDVISAMLKAWPQGVSA